jgi:hypothetical protein
MKTFKICLIVFFSILPVIPVSAGSQQQSEQEKELMEKWMQFATPGKGHEFLKKQVGEWEVISKMWERPGREPVITKGPGTGEMIMGGRYLKMTYKGTMDGMPFEGMSIYAYDNHLKQYLSVWIDNMGTGFLLSRGSLDPSGRVLTKTAEVENIFTGEKEKARTVITFVNPDKFIMEMFMEGPQGEFRSLEVTHIRRK